MYILIGERAQHSELGAPGAATINLNGWQATHSALGQGVFPSPPCIRKPTWLPLLNHVLISKSPLITGKSPFQGKWKSAPSSGILHPDLMNPGYINLATRTPNVDPILNAGLQSLMTKLFANQTPFDQDPDKTFVNKRGKIRVALVDLSTDEKNLFPKLAAYDSTTITYGASLSKIAALYAAHQLKFDLKIQAQMNPASMTPDRIRKLKTIFDVTQTGHPAIATFEFKRDFLEALNAICENWAANTIMRALGFPYIASALWQSGLYDCRRGGIWLGGLYDKCKTLWHLDPVGNQCHGVTALAVATFFTLLAQGRLIDDQSSQRIKDYLVKQRSFCRSFFEEGLQNVGRFASSDRIYSKIGVYGSFYHEGALIERTHNGKKLRYVAVVLTESGAGYGHEILRNLIVALDELIRINNP